MKCIQTMVLAAGLVLVACEGRRAAPGSFGSGAPVVRPAQALAIGGSGDRAAPAFARVLRALIGPDDLLYVLDEGRAEVLVFDGSGAAVRTVGRRGPGPGEFSGPSGFGFVGDTLWVQDWVRPRTHFFRLDGTHLETREIAIRIDSTRFSGVDIPVALLADGGALFEPATPNPDLPPDAEAPVVYQVLATGARDTLALRRVWRQEVPLPGLGTLRVRRVLDYPLLAIDGSGRRVAIVEQAGDDTMRVNVSTWNHRGERISNAELHGLAAEAVSPSLRDSIVEGATRALERTMDRIAEVRNAVTDPRAMIERVVTVPKLVPPLSDARVMRDGSVWLRAQRASSAQSWFVVDDDGRVTRIIELPAGLDLQDATSTRAWGLMKDSLEVQVLVGFDLRTPERPAPGGGSS